MDIIMCDYKYLLWTILFSSHLGASGFSKLSFLNSNEISPTGERACNFKFEFNEVNLKTSEIARKFGLKFQKHNVVTADGYVLELHRLPAPGKPPVYLLHGLFQQSRDFFINCDRRALAVRLADEGFDVWLGNLRGNFYSLNHISLSNVIYSDYWDFSIDDMIAYDAPATVDYILNATKNSQLSWAGYAVGSEIMLGLLSSRPEYNSKVKIGFSLGATAIFSKQRSPLIRLIVPYTRLLERLISEGNSSNREVIPRQLTATLHRVVPLLCLPEARARQDGLCALGVFLADGYDPQQIDARVRAVVAGGFPTSVSVRCLVQWLQWITVGNMAYYNYGAFRNFFKYGHLLVPFYEIQNVVAPVVSFWGENDFLAAPQDVKSTVRKFPHVNKLIRVNSSSWNHADFLYGKDADVYIYDYVITLLRRS